MELKGIDVSSWSHGADKPINWEAVKKDGYGFTVIKSSQGTDYKNPYLSEDAIEANHNGLLVGCYHYAVPAKGDAVAQARFAAACVHGLPLSLGVALDLEETGTLAFFELGEWAKEFMTTMNEMGHMCPLYSNENYLGQLVGAPWGHKLWYASKDLPPTYMGVRPWMVQTTENKDVSGVPGLVDFDTFYGVRGANAQQVPNAPKAHVAEEAPTEAPEMAEDGALAGTVSSPVPVPESSGDTPAG